MVAERARTLPNSQLATFSWHVGNAGLMAGTKNKCTYICCASSRSTALVHTAAERNSQVLWLGASTSTCNLFLYPSFSPENEEEKQSFISTPICSSPKQNAVPGARAFHGTGLNPGKLRDFPTLKQLLAMQR